MPVSPISGEGLPGDEDLPGGAELHSANGSAELHSAKADYKSAPPDGRTELYSMNTQADFKSAPPTVGEELIIRQRRLPHWEAGGSTYFITFKLKDVKSKIPGGAELHSANPIADYKSALLLTTERTLVKQAILFWHPTKWYIHALTIMPDHVHIIAQPQKQSHGRWFTLSSILQSVKRQSARDVNKSRGIYGSLWQDENFDRIIRDEKEFNEKFNYIIGNAVKTGLVADGWEYDGFWCPGKEELSDIEKMPGGAELHSANSNTKLYSLNNMAD